MHPLVRPLLVLITSFQPYDGAPTNGSLEVARALASAAAPDLAFTVCPPLPVDFGTAARAAVQCLDELPAHPDLIVSLGEDLCQISLETFAHNLRSEATGQTRIDVDGPTRRPATLPFVDMYCALPVSSRATVEPSVWPGFFVCNDVAFAMAARAESLRIPYGFVHVPSPSACPGAAPAAHTAARLIEMLRSRSSASIACRDEFFARLARAEDTFRHRDDWRWTPREPRP